MPRVIVRLPTGVRLPEMPDEIGCDGSTVAEALADCAQKEPRLKYRLFHRDGSPGVECLSTAPTYRLKTRLQSRSRMATRSG